MAAPPPSVTSTGNERVKWVRGLLDRKQRRLERRFLIEGVRLVEAALAAGARPELLLVDAEALRATARGAALLRRLRGLPVLDVSGKVLRSVADTVSPQGIVGVVPMPEATSLPLPLPLPAAAPLLLILDGLQDPGNVGAILRSAEAAGVGRVALTSGAVDVWSPKTVRAAMGAHFALQLTTDLDPATLPPDLPLWLADGSAVDATPHWSVNWTTPAVLIIGNEARGADPTRWPPTTPRVRIPIHGQADSLNAAMAASVILFEAARQRAAG